MLRERRLKAVLTLRRAVAVLLPGLFACGSATAQIIELRNVDGKTIDCVHSGLTSTLNDCGNRSNWYDYVFVGSISAINPANNDEKQLQITPEEVFLGEPLSPLAVLTSQGACLPKMTVGDRWLFFLRQEGGKPITLDYYGNDSRPVAQAQKKIETLRRLQTIGDFGILRGKVSPGSDDGEQKPGQGLRVVASKTSDRAQYVATTDANGYYEFEPLPVGKYDVAVDSIGLHQGDAAIEVRRGACWDMMLWKPREPPQARLSGHVKRSDGKPLSEVPILIVREDGSWFTTEKSDADGHFQKDSLSPGKYIVGINLPGALPWKVYGCAGDCKHQIPEASLYYPGMHNRSDALVITLNDNEKRDDIDFSLSTR